MLNLIEKNDKLHKPPLKYGNRNNYTPELLNVKIKLEKLGSVWLVI